MTLLAGTGGARWALAFFFSVLLFMPLLYSLIPSWPFLPSGFAVGPVPYRSENSSRKERVAGVCSGLHLQAPSFLVLGRVWGCPCPDGDTTDPDKIDNLREMRFVETLTM